LIYFKAMSNIHWPSWSIMQWRRVPPANNPHEWQQWTGQAKMPVINYIKTLFNSYIILFRRNYWQIDTSIQSNSPSCDHPGAHWNYFGSSCGL